VQKPGAKTDTESIDNRALDYIIENSRFDTMLKSIKGTGKIKDQPNWTASIETDPPSTPFTGKEIPSFPLRRPRT